jgi:Ca2+-binding RTX toxin-like protein
MSRPSIASPLALALALALVAAPPVDAAPAVKVVFKHGRLVVVGTDAPETIIVSRSGPTVRVSINGKFVTPRPKPQAKLTKSIVVRASGGDDTVTVDSTGGPLPRATLKGGDGNDTVRGSSASDVLRGGAGNDVLRQGGGDDTLSGEQGDDVYLLDADGADALVRLVERAGGGTDTVDFSSTTTTGLTVDLGKATQLLTPTYGLALSPPGAFESLVGGSQDDSLRGGPGSNTVLGGPGSDLLNNSEGADTLDGGAGDSAYGIDGDLAGATTVVEAGGPEVDVISLAATTGVDTQLDTSSTAVQAVSGPLTVQLSSGTAFDRIIGGDLEDALTGNALPNLISGLNGDDDLRGGAEDDSLFDTAGDNTLQGEAGDDTYVLDGDASGLQHLVESTGGGSDTLYFAETQLTGVDVDLSDTGTQSVTGSLAVQLNADDTFEEVTGSEQDDTIAGGVGANTFRGLAGNDTYVHHGPGDGIDTIVGGLNAAIGEQVLFDTAGAVSAGDLTLDSNATQLRDAATGTFGFDFGSPVLNGTSFYVFGTTDTSPAGQLITFNGTGGFGQGSNVDSLIASYSTNGSTIGGAGGKDRIIDLSPNGNSLIGRDGTDVMIGGDGDDTLQGDRGFAPGVADTYTGGTGADTFRFGEAFGGGATETFGGDTVTDFGDGADAVDLFTGLSVKSGLGTASVTVWDGATDFGTITSTNGHLWIAGDFT